MSQNSPDQPSPQGCEGPCCPDPDRRQFLNSVGLGSLAVLSSEMPAVAGPFEETDFDRLVPADKKLQPAWLRSLTERGSATIYRGAALGHIGMPVGGLCAGQLYLGGDGKLWHWDIFNLPQGGDWANAGGPHYAHPARPTAPLEQGFALKVTSGGKSQVYPLDRRGFKDITFRGQYPIGFVDYRDPMLPVTVSLEAFSPFIPLHVEDSTLPATVMHFSVKNTSTDPIEIELGGWLENGVCLGSGQLGAGQRRNGILHLPEATLLHCWAEAAPKKKVEENRPDILFEDFEKETYPGWKVVGTAFGRGPVKRTEIPLYQGDVGGKGERVANSHASAPGNEVGQKDAAQGKLTSPSFTIQRNYIHFFIGGGSHQGRTCVNLVVDGQAVRTATGRNHNHMEGASFDVRSLQGKKAFLEIVDAVSGPWGNIGVDHIVFSDTLREPFVLTEQVDYGSLGLALLGEGQGTWARPFVPPEGRFPEAVFHQGPESREATASFGRKLIGALGRRWTLGAGQQVEAVFLLTWYFPRLPRGRFEALMGTRDLRRSFAQRFDSAAAVARYVAGKFDELAGQTRLWNRTWYDSTLPYWFLDRTFLTLCCVATATAYRFTNGRFYAYEGTYCCDGTCTHVWQYAQALARIFPQLERSTRERVDYGLAFHADTGAMDYRAEYARHVAHDGQAGTILRAYREHLTSTDSAYLKRNWPKIKKSIQYLINRDLDRDGLLDGEQYNTLDASWFGHIAWISSLYLACVRAGSAMAQEMGDAEFARVCDTLCARGQKHMVEKLFNGEYFIHLVDPKHPEAINTNKGCHIDQVFGQSWAFQVGLPRILPAEQSRSALEALWRYNFTPDVGPYRKQFNVVIPGGRWYAMPGEGGLLMCTWPKGGGEKAKGRGGEPGFVAYFNECMTGFEYQVAAHMIWEGLVEKGLAIARMIHDRYDAFRRNPFNEIECSDHYARSMASYGVFLAACGFDYHGPKGHLAFAPRLTPEKFRAPFTAAEGWGTFSQERVGPSQRHTIEVRWGQLRLKSLAFELSKEARPGKVAVKLQDRTIAATYCLEKNQCLVALDNEIVIPKAGCLTVVIE